MFNLIRRLLRDCRNEAIADRIAAEVGDSTDALSELVKFTLNPQEKLADSVARTPIEREMLAAIARASQRQNHLALTSEAAPLIRIQAVPLAADVLAGDRGCEGWTLAQWISSVIMREAHPTKRAAVIATMRDDGLSALEWIAHHRVLGFDTIFIYSNDNVDGSDALLRELASHGVIVYLENHLDPSICQNPQRKAFAHALHLLPELWEHEWAFFLDSDEFFVPGKTYDFRLASLLDDIESRFPARPPSAVCFNWRWYVSGEAFSYDPKLLLTRFQYANAHPAPKSLVRLRDVLSMRQLHFPDIVSGGFLVRADFRRFDEEQRWTNVEPFYENGQINHYWHKSFEEFSIKKARGDTLVAKNNAFARDFELFFAWNGSEGPENHVPPPDSLVAAVEAECRRLSALPGVEDHLAEIRARLPCLLARFESQGGLRSIYERARAAAVVK